MVSQTITSLKGIAASAGIAYGPVFLYKTHQLVVSKHTIKDVDNECARLTSALDQGKKQLQTLYDRAREMTINDRQPTTDDRRPVAESSSLSSQSSVVPEPTSPEADIFQAHLMMLEDPELIERVMGTIEREHCNAEYAWNEGTAFYASALRDIGDEYLAARAADVEDVAKRVQGILQGVVEQEPGPDKPSVIVASDLSPSDTVTFDKLKVLAFCTGSGGPTSHVAILSKALGIPAVVGLGAQLPELAEGSMVIVDGGAGDVLIEPGGATVQEYLNRKEAQKAQDALALESAGQLAVTLDGTRIEVVANIGSAQDAVTALKHGAEGVGLLRTEFLFLDRDSAPTEDEQYGVYRSVLETMGQASKQYPVVIRTLDIGGDKPAPYMDMPVELNPFLGVRGARLSFVHPDLFQTQLRALLRAGEGHNLKIMAPMISSLEEVQALRAQVDEARAALQARGVPYSPDAELGIMVEVPSAALMADLLAPAVDFFSIGTNDLSQYTLAADRTNASVAPLADAFHPAVLRLIGIVAAATHAHGKWLGLCGELAGDPLAAPVLLGLGVDELSMNSRAIPAVKQTIRRYSVADAGEIARQALSLATAVEVREYLESVRK